MAYECERFIPWVDKNIRVAVVAVEVARLEGWISRNYGKSINLGISCFAEVLSRAPPKWQELSYCDSESSGCCCYG